MNIRDAIAVLLGYNINVCQIDNDIVMLSRPGTQGIKVKSNDIIFCALGIDSGRLNPIDGINELFHKGSK